MPNLDNQTILLAILAVTALAVLLQAFMLLAILVSVRHAARSLRQEIEDLRSAVTPVCERSWEFLARVGPQFEATVTDAAAVTRGLRKLTAEVEITTQEILVRLHHQSGRLDAMLSGVLDNVDRAGAVLVDSVSKPARQFSGLLASVRAVIDSLRSSGRAQRQTISRLDDDRFI